MKKMPELHKMVTLFAFGANGGTCVNANARRIAAARRHLAGLFPGSWRHAGLWRSPAWPPGSGPDFVNTVSLLQRLLPPELALRQLHAIEARAGRVRSRRWAPRVLDIDLLAVALHVRPGRPTVQHWIDLSPEEQARQTPGQLLLPHPRLQDRGFVLAPLCEIAPLWRHPLTGQTVRQMMATLPAEQTRDVKPLRLGAEFAL